MPILLCSCGKRLSVGDEHAGKRVKCPGCNAVLTVPAAGAASAPPPLVQPTPSAPPPPYPPPPVSVQPRPSAPPLPSSPPPLRPRRGSSAWVFLLIAVVLLAVGGAVAWFVLFGGGTAPDLAYVPGDAQGFASVRVGDLWNSAAVKDALKNQPGGMSQASIAGLMEGAVGLKPEDIERATLVVQDAEKGVGWGVVALNKPVEQKDLLSKLGALAGGPLKESTHKGKTYHVGEKGSPPLAIHFASNKILILGPEDGVKRCLEGEGGKPSGLLGRGVSAASSKKDIVIAVTFTDKMKEEVRTKTPKGAVDMFGALLEAQGVLIQGSLDSKLALEATLSFPNDDKAKAGKTALELAKSLGQIGLAQMRKAPNMPDLGPMMDKAEGVLKDLTIDQSGSDVRVQVKVDAETVAAGPALMLPAVWKVRDSAGKAQSQNNLWQLALAMHAYHDTNRTLPPCVKYSPDGKPLWSWRVELLPYIEQGDMYNALNKNEPWNSPHNSQVLAKMPKTYQMPGKPENNMTYYQVFQGKGAIFDAAAKQGPSLAAVMNQKGTSNVILIAESANPVPWAAPGDIDVSLDPNDPTFDPRALGGHFGDVFNVVMADGSKLTLSRSINPRTLGSVITPSGPLVPLKDG